MRFSNEDADADDDIDKNGDADKDKESWELSLLPIGSASFAEQSSPLSSDEYLQDDSISIILC